MTKGILMLAWGKRGYGFMAYNLAVSLKHHSPEIAIHLIVTEKVLKEISDRSVFDNIEWLADDPDEPGKFKAAIYDMLPFDYTLFLDVDALCVAPIDKLFNDLIDSGVHYATYINEIYDINSPNILPQMYWAYRTDIWQQYGFDESTRFPATQSSIQFIKRCDKTAELYRLFNEAFNNPIPLERLRNKWGGGQPDELYLNIALAQQGEINHIGDNWIYFGNSTAKRPHEISSQYGILSMFGNRGNIKPQFWDFYDGQLARIQAKRNLRHIYKGHILKSDKIANQTSPRTKIKVPVKNHKPDSVKFQKQSGKVALFTSYFEQKHLERQRELRKAMQLNIACDSIDTIINLGKAYDDAKVVNLDEYDRPTYADFIKEMQNVEADYYILANSDIYFTSEIEQIKDLNLDGKVLCLSRWDVQPNGFSKLFDYEWTQDTWIWKGKPKQINNVDFYLGIPACDNRFAYELSQNSLKPINPSKDIKTYHLHNSNKRTYTEKNRLEGPTLPIDPTTADAYKIKTVLIYQPGKVGDIICCLPIAQWYVDRGFKVYWQCPKQYHSLFDYVDNICPIESRSGKYDKVIDIAFGIDEKSQHHMNWIKQRRTLDSFVQLKYKIAEVPISELRNLKYKRNESAEETLFDMLGLSAFDSYALTHLNSDYGTAALCFTEKPVVEFKKVGEFTIFDWRKVIENASEIHAIDSSLCNFVDAIDTKAELNYYITDKIPIKADKTILTKNWITHDMA